MSASTIPMFQLKSILLKGSQFFSLTINATCLFFQIESLHYGSGKPQVDFASYYGHGVAYVVVVTAENRSQFYVPILTYNCHYDQNTGACDMKTVGKSWFSQCSDQFKHIECKRIDRVGYNVMKCRLQCND